MAKKKKVAKGKRAIPKAKRKVPKAFRKAKGGESSVACADAPKLYVVSADTMEGTEWKSEVLVINCLEYCSRAIEGSYGRLSLSLDA